MALGPRVHGVILKDLWRVHGWGHGPGGVGTHAPMHPVGGKCLYYFYRFSDFGIFGFQVIWGKTEKAYNF